MCNGVHCSNGFNQEVFAFALFNPFRTNSKHTLVHSLTAGILIHIVLLPYQMQRNFLSPYVHLCVHNFSYIVHARNQTHLVCLVLDVGGTTNVSNASNCHSPSRWHEFVLIRSCVSVCIQILCWAKNKHGWIYCSAQTSSRLRRRRCLRTCRPSMMGTRPTAETETE